MSSQRSILNEVNDFARDEVLCVHIGTSQVLVSLGNSFIIFMVEYTYKLR